MGVDELAPHEAESGLVTSGELALAHRWAEMVTAVPGTDRWVDGWLAAGLPFCFRCGGEESGAVLSRWHLERRELQTEDASTRHELLWTDPASGLRLTWQVRRFHDYPAVEWVLLFENAGASASPLIEDVQALDLALQHRRPGQRFAVHGAHGGRSLPDDMMPLTRLLPDPAGDTEVQLCGELSSSNRHLPFFNLETPDGRGVMVGVGWSGNWLGAMSVEGATLRARVGLKETRFVLQSAEQARTPRVLLLFWEGKRLHGHNMLRQLLHCHYVPPLRGQLMEPPASVNVCFTHHGLGGFLHQATEETVLPLVEPFIRLGAELFIIDAGWYDGEPWTDWMGNWRYSRSKYPRGFRPIADRLAEAGVPFGLWFAPENLNATAPLVRERPELVRRQEPGTWATLRLELLEARAWFLEQLADLVAHEGVTCYRQDGLPWYGEDAPDRVGLSETHHLTGLYALWNEIRDRYPHLVMEGCAGGGRRVDLETLSRFHWHQKSDRWYDSESDQCSLYGANLFLPGGVINIPTEGTDDYAAWSSFAGQFCLGWHPLDPDFPMEQARRQVALYKRVRPFLAGDFYPLTPCSLEEEWMAYQFHRPDLDRGFALVFRRPAPAQRVLPRTEALALHLRGLRPETRYEVEHVSAARMSRHTGADLGRGVEVVLREAPAAEMLVYGPAGGQ